MPAKQMPAGNAHDDCAICASVHMAASLLLPEPPAVAPPTVFGLSPHPARLEFGLAAFPYSLFRTRAPPLA